MVMTSDAEKRRREERGGGEERRGEDTVGIRRSATTFLEEASDVLNGSGASGRHT